ncbi:MAG: filamentous hemagglutinin N-terminal domain-containing protein [Calothrix sp. MO_167.B12]|nr:filamentous hemagglutinin N-terminal domain-containing protein [Calothrix sp. MO_167.B12]
MKSVCRYLFYLTFPLATLATVSSVRAQSITSDGTLSTQVQSNDGLNFDITQGNRQGNNLFHSFGNFSVPNNGSARFQNPTDIANIFSRVTGGNLSNINGLIQAQGTANLFLINPNGIVFGPNASLNIGGSFFASTASSILFDGGVEFSAMDTQSSSLLSVNMPIGLRFRNNPGSITIGNDQVNNPTSSSVSVEVQPGKTLAFVGGEINLNGRRLRAPGGRIELGALAAEGVVGINNDFSLSFPDGIARADVSLNTADADVTSGDKGSISINANNINILSSSDLCAGIGADGVCGGLATNFGSVGSQAGDVTLNALDTITISGSVSSVRSQVNTGAVGNSGNISIRTRNLLLEDGALLSASNLGLGDAGRIEINATGSIRFDGQGGDEFFTGALSIIGSDAVGNAGGVFITAGSLEVLNGAQVSASTRGQGNAGTVTINATDLIKFDGESSGAFSRVSSSADGNAGGVLITAGSLEVLNGAQISSGNFGLGNGGDILIQVGDSINIASSSSINSSIGNGGLGNGGDIDILGKSLTLTDDSIINSGIFGKGDAGNISVKVNGDVTLTNSSNIFSNVESNGIGNAGNINLIANNIFLKDGSQLASSIRGLGNGAKISLVASGEISFTGFSNIDSPGNPGFFLSGVFSNVGTGGVGIGGDIDITAGTLFLDGAFINSNNLGQGDAGNISVTVADSINLANNSFIDSTLFNFAEGVGGDINLTGRSLSLTNSSQINSGTFAQGNAGNISVRVADSINLANNSFISSFVGSGGFGNGGDINLTGRSLTLTDGSQIGALVFRESNNLPGGIGTAGNIDINMTDFINISGAADTGFSSGLFASAEIGTTATEPKAAGDITVTTSNFRLSDGAVIQASTANVGDGGKITINANNFATTNSGKISTTTFSDGNAGNIKLNISDRITISGIDSGIFANTTEGSTGNGGNINIDPKTVEIDGSIISAESLGTGNPGSIDIQVDELLLLRRGAKISTLSVQDNDNISNIKINTGILVAFPEENSDITANAGGVEIFAQGIFGIVPRDFLTDFSDITARSEIDINNPEVDPIPGLVELPETVIDPDSQIAQNPCQQGIGSTFTATGRGGLPPNPTQDLSIGTARVDLATPVVSQNTATNTTATQPKSTPTKKKLVPAQGWVFNSKGQIVLTAYDPNQIGVQRTAHKGLCRAK